MKDLAIAVIKSLWQWRTVIFIGTNGWFIAVGGAIIGAHVLSPKAESWIGALIVGSKFLEGYISQGIARLKKEISDNGSNHDTTLWKVASAVAQAPAVK